MTMDLTTFQPTFYQVWSKTILTLTTMMRMYTNLTNVWTKRQRAQRRGRSACALILNYAGKTVVQIGLESSRYHTQSVPLRDEHSRHNNAVVEVKSKSLVRFDVV
ncbi:hypothetical protein PHMEG_00016477 [Phytophthora megakarya]|uniref:Uncharacterized protein n=1 Tax=Phytophthora megakarya TaxID=4795 RepID=A0A225W1B0_9STRA|nr:hypothetical protein PHMEG_00016477 [Phytophthora megakarya]